MGIGLYIIQQIQNKIKKKKEAVVVVVFLHRV